MTTRGERQKNEAQEKKKRTPLCVLTGLLAQRRCILFLDDPEPLAVVASALFRGRCGRGCLARRRLLEAIGSAKFLAESLHATGRIDELLLAGEERMAGRTISTLILGTVLRVVNVLPQAQWAVQF